MFERRLKFLLSITGVAALAILARLAQLQLVRADYYRARSESSLILTPLQTPFVRGRILDRTGSVLVSDEACWDVTVDFDVLAADATHDANLVNIAARRPFPGASDPAAGTDIQAGTSFHNELDRMWTELARFSSRLRPLSVEELRDRGREIHDRIKRVRRAVAQRRGFDAPVAEELDAHAVLSGLSAEDQIEARVRFSDFPWVHVQPSSYRRFAADAAPWAHVLGRLGRVTADDVNNDPFDDDPFAAYRADEHLGVSGVEWTAERILRGRRGQITKDRQGREMASQSFPALNGEDVTLTIHAELQRRLYDLLGQAVHDIPESAGGAIVVLDVASREALALVSYPSYDPGRYVEQYALLADDTQRLPLWFRAVASQYPPGSTVKPLVCLAGLMNGRIGLHSREHCSGYLFDDVRDRWRCWQVEGTSLRKAHGDVDVVEALTGSCNVFMYRLGESLGVDSLCSVFDMVGVGRLSGLGLPEEVSGINPTSSWLMENKNMRPTAGGARLYAIGQGELAMTPVQVANLLATYAGGRFRQVSVIQKETPSPEWTLPISPTQWSAIRRGIYGVVNDPNGTAYKYARFDHPRWALCGKTGSATAHPWPTAYRVPYRNEAGESREAIIRTGSWSSAIERFSREYPNVAFDSEKVEVAARWPLTPPTHGEEHSHAWFGGFLQPLGAGGEPDWSRTAPLAFAILVEFGGSGGRTSGPLAQKVSAILLDAFGPDLTVSTGPATPRSGGR